MRGFLVVSLCLLLAAGSHGFLFDSSTADSFKNFFKDLGAKIVTVGKAFGEHALDTAKNLAQDAVKATGLALANAVHPIMNTPVTADGRKRALKMNRSFPLLEHLQKGYVKLEAVIESGVHRLQEKLNELLSGKVEKIVEFKRSIDETVAEHLVQARSVFGDVLGHVIDYGKAVLNFVRDRADKLKETIGLGKREWAQNAEEKLTAMLADIAAVLHHGVENAMKYSVASFADLIKHHADQHQAAQAN